MAVRTKASQVVPVAGQITSGVLQGTTRVEPTGHNTGLSGGSFVSTISTAGTTVVFTGQARLCRVHVTGSGGTVGAITIYDNTAASGRVLFGPQVILPGTYEDFQIVCGIGITVVTAANTTVDVNYEDLT